MKKAMKMKKRMIPNTGMYHKILKNHWGQKKRQPMVFDGKDDKRCYGSARYDEDHRWLYFSVFQRLDS